MFVVHVLHPCCPETEKDANYFARTKERESILSTEEIISAWKSNEDDPDKKLQEKKLQEKSKRKGKTPANPAGQQEITDDDLKAVEGGLTPMTCDVFSC